MIHVECSDPAYFKIKDFKIEEKIINNKDKLGFDINTIPYTKKGKKIINEAKQHFFSNNKINEHTQLYKDILELKCIVEDEYYSDLEFKDDCIKHPGLLSYYILGKDLLNYKKFGFPSMRSLEEAVVSYCIGERDDYDGAFCNNLIWRNNGKKNVLVQDVHGDMYVNQYDVFGNEKQLTTLFGNKTSFDSMKINPIRGGIYGYQDWSGYLVAALKYAERLGKSRMPEIINWHEIYRNLHRGGNYAEAGDKARFGLENFIENMVITKHEKLNEFPLYVRGFESNHLQYPYFEDEKLFFIVENKEGNINLDGTAPFFENKKFIKVLEYSESDLPNMLKGCYKLFSRVVADMFYIMKNFNSKH